MLILPRSANPGHNRIVLTTPEGVTIALQVLECRGGTVRLGFDAPQAVAIMRGEKIPETPPASLETPRAG